MSNVINQIKSLLGMEVKLAQMSLDNGTVIEAEVFEAGAAVFIVNGEDRVALPIGEYKLEDDMILVVAEEGIIAEIKPEVEEVAPAEVEVEQELQEEPVAKKVIESIVKESHFSKEEEIEALKSEIEELKKQIDELKKGKEEKTEMSAVEPLTHNPESKPEVKLNLYGQKRTRTTLDNVLSKIVK